MKKKMLFLMLLLISVFCFLTKVEAEQTEGTCYVVDKNYVKTQASNIRVTYSPVVKDEKTKDSLGNEAITSNRYIQIKLFNVTSNMYLEVTTSGDKIRGSKYKFDYRDIGPDKAITIEQKAIDSTVTYSISVYSDYNDCYGDLLRTIKLTVPKFNFYSQLAACDDISDYYLCQEFITFDINSSTFYSNVDSYKEKLANNVDDNPTIRDNTTTASKTVSIISKYKYLIVGTIVVAGVLATIFIMKRKKSE